MQLKECYIRRRARKTIKVGTRRKGGSNRPTSYQSTGSLRVYALHLRRLSTRRLEKPAYTPILRHCRALDRPSLFSLACVSQCRQHHSVSLACPFRAGHCKRHDCTSLACSRWATVGSITVLHSPDCSLPPLSKLHPILRFTQLTPHSPFPKLFSSRRPAPLGLRLQTVALQDALDVLANRTARTHNTGLVRRQGRVRPEMVAGSGDEERLDARTRRSGDGL